MQFIFQCFYSIDLAMSVEFDPSTKTNVYIKNISYSLFHEKCCPTFVYTVFYVIHEYNQMKT